MSILVAPSILSADFRCLERQVKELDDVVDMWHLDIMDGVFVPNISFGEGIVKVMRELSSRLLDVHLMISRPLFFCKRFLDAGADLLTAHIEAFEEEGEVLEFIDEVRRAGKKVGIALKPSTGCEKISFLLDKIDLVLVMTVEPGFGGQEFMEGQVEKIKELRKRFDGIIGVDGGINDISGRICRYAGADLLISGTYILKSNNPFDKISSLRQ